MIVRKWNHKTREYDPYELPEGASCYEDDMEKVVHCAQCGREVPFGDCYTSREVHTRGGFGYGVCRECYEQEWERERKSHHEGG